MFVVSIIFLVPCEVQLWFRILLIKGRRWSKSKTSKREFKKKLLGGEPPTPLKESLDLIFYQGKNQGGGRAPKSLNQTSSYPCDRQAPALRTIK